MKRDAEGRTISRKFRGSFWWKDYWRNPLYIQKISGKTDTSGDMLSKTRREQRDKEKTREGSRVLPPIVQYNASTLEDKWIKIPTMSARLLFYFVWLMICRHSESSFINLLHDKLFRAASCWKSKAGYALHWSGGQNSRFSATEYRQRKASSTCLLPWPITLEKEKP